MLRFGRALSGLFNEADGSSGGGNAAGDAGDPGGGAEDFRAKYETLQANFQAELERQAEALAIERAERLLSEIGGEIPDDGAGSGRDDSGAAGAGAAGDDGGDADPVASLNARLERIERGQNEAAFNAQMRALQGEFPQMNPDAVLRGFSRLYQMGHDPARIDVRQLARISHEAGMADRREFATKEIDQGLADLDARLKAEGADPLMVFDEVATNGEGIAKVVATRYRDWTKANLERLRGGAPPRIPTGAAGVPGRDSRGSSGADPATALASEMVRSGFSSR